MNYLNIFYFIVEHYSVLIVFLSIAYLFGTRILVRASIPYNASKIFLSLSCGFGGMIVLLFYAALFGLFTKSSIIIISLLSLISSFRKGIWASFRTEFHSSSRRVIEIFMRNWNWLLPAFLIAAPALLKPLYPPVMFDETMYHLPQAKNIVIHHGLNLNPSLRYPLFPQNFEILYAALLLFYDDISSHLIHGATAIITALGIYSLGALTSSKKTGLVGAVIFLSSSLVQILMQSAYIEHGLTLFLFLGFYCIALWTITEKTNWLYLAGFATGIAAGTKYLALTYALLYTIWIAYEGRSIKHVSKFICFVIVFGSPWYIRNFIFSGDPVFPFGGEIFGYSWLWDRSDTLGQYHDLLKAHGTPHTILSLLILPWNLIMHPENFMKGEISLWMLAIFPSIFLIKRFDTFHRKLCVFVSLNMIIWFFSSQILRYLLPLFPLMSLLSAYVLVDLYDNSIKKSFPENIQAIKLIYNKLFYYFDKKSVSVAVIAVLLIIQGMQLNRTMNKKPLPVTQKLRIEYLSKQKPAYQLIQIANMDASLHIYQILFEDHFYYAEGQIAGDHFGPARYSTILNIFDKSDKLYNKLMTMDIQLLLLNKKIFESFKLDESFPKYFLLVAENDKGALYGLRNNDKVMQLFHKVHGIP
jgi:4-amino-4-deoxy-L-arabinose transferase-like glycosyltransferase